jgi:putative MATE family efflux protein
LYKDEERTMPDQTAIDRRRDRLLTGPVGPVLFALSWPGSLGLFSVIAFNVVDTLYIGRLGAAPLAAIGYCFPVIFGLSAIAIGMGNGAASVVSRAIGGGEPAQARELTLNTLVFVTACTLVLAGGMYLFSDVFFGLLGAPPALMPYIDQYMDVWYAGLPFLILPIVLNGLVRAAGEAIVPSVLMLVAAGLNAIISPLLIFGMFGLPELGMAGAAWATIFARGVIAVLGVAYLMRLNLVVFSIEALRHFRECIAEILKFGFPAFLAQAVSPLAGGIITRLLSEQGPDAVAAYAVGARLETLALVPFFALQTGIGPFVGQNVGAGRVRRLRRAERVALVFCLGWGLFSGLVLFAFGESLAGLFTTDPVIVTLSDTYLGWVAFGLWGAGFMIASVGILNPLGYPLVGMLLSALRYLLLYAGGAALFVLWTDDAHEAIEGIFIAAPLSYALTGLVAFVLITRLIVKPRRARGRNARAPRPIVGHDDLRPNRHPSERSEGND